MLDVTGHCQEEFQKYFFMLDGRGWGTGVRSGQIAGVKDDQWSQVVKCHGLEEVQKLCPQHSHSLAGQAWATIFHSC